MLITVEHAPDLVVGPAAASFRVASFASLGLNSSLYELQGAAPKGIDLDQYSVTVLTAPVCEVVILGTETLDKREQVEKNCRL
jgi:hypothetical protein